MSGERACDECLVRRLPLPLARLYRRAHNAKTAVDRHQAALYLWEAALRLLGSMAVVTYAERGEHDPDLAELLQKSLARPSLGQWCGIVRELVPVLADGGDAGFQKIRDLKLGRQVHDLVAELDSFLGHQTHDAPGSRRTVRLDALFNLLVQYRNEMAHEAGGMRPGAPFDRLARSLLAGAAELFGQPDVLAGRRLVYIGEVRGQADGRWLVEWYELTGESARRLEPLLLPEHDAPRLPRPERIYLDETCDDRHGQSPNDPGRMDDATDGARVPHSALHPLVIFDFDAGEALFLNPQRGRRRIKYVSFTAGQLLYQEELGRERRELLAQILGSPVDSTQMEQWEAQAQKDEEEVAPSPIDEPAAAPLRHLGEFEPRSVLGRGSMGVVYRAWQPSLDREVALKRVRGAGDPKAEKRFDREIHALGKVDHPNLVKIFTSGHEGEDCFYAMELVEGATLASVSDALTSRGSSAAGLELDAWKTALSTACEAARTAERPLSDPAAIGPAPAPTEPDGQAPATSARSPLQRRYVQHVVDLIRQVALAAHALHEKGVVHRDIKPGNIMVTPDGIQAVLMDLGLAQLADDVQGTLTRTREFVGTLRYASPEQVLAAGRLDRRSDVYSLGATLWELLTLRPMFGATEQTPIPDLMRQITSDDPERIRKHNPGVASDLDAIVRKCLEKDPGRRYATAAEFAEDLDRWQRGDPVVARPPTVRYVVGKAIRRHRVPLAMAGLVAVALVTGLVSWGVVQVTQAEAGLLRERQKSTNLKVYQSDLRVADEFLQAGLVEEAGKALGRARPQFDPEQGDLRGFEWFYLRQQIHTAGRMRLAGHVGSVTAIAYSPDGKTLAVASEGNLDSSNAVVVGTAKPGEVRLWDLARRRVRAVLPSGGGKVLDIAFSPDGKTIATAGDGPRAGEVLLWDAGSGRASGVLRAPSSDPSHPQPASVKRGAVKSLAFSPDGKTLAGVFGGEADAVEGGTASLWDVANGRVIRSHTISQVGKTFAVAFSPVGESYAVSGLSWVIVYDAATGEERKSIYLDQYGATCLAYSPDGSTLAAGGGNGVMSLIDLVAGQVVEHLHSRVRMYFFTTAFSPDGSTLATGNMDGTIQLWDVATGRERAMLRGNNGSIRAIAFAPDGSSLASGSRDGTVTIWDPAGDQCADSVKDVIGEVNALAFTPDGSTLATGGGILSSADYQEFAEVKLWDSSTGQMRAALQERPPDSMVMAVSPDGTLLATGALTRNPSIPGELTLWDVALRRVRSRLHGHLGSITAAAFSPDGKTLATGCSAGGNSIPRKQPATVMLWDVSTGRSWATLRGHMGFIACIVYSPDGETLATSSYSLAAPPRPCDVRLWDAATGRQRSVLNGLTATVSLVAFSPDGKTLAASEFNPSNIEKPCRVTFWDAVTGQQSDPFPPVAGSILSLTYSPDGKTLATGGFNGELKLWDVAARKVRQPLIGHVGMVDSLSYAPDGKTLASSSKAVAEIGSADVRLWDVTTGQERASIRGSMGSAEVLILPDGRTLATSSRDGVLKLWDTASADEVATLLGADPDASRRHSAPVTSLAYSPDGRTLATGSADRSAKLWDLATGHVLQTLPGHSDTVLCVTFSPDGKLLATGSGNLEFHQGPGEIRLWDLATAQLLGIFEPPHTGGVSCLAFSPNGKTLASVHATLGDHQEVGEVRLWDVAAREVVATLKDPKAVWPKCLAFSPDGAALAVGYSVKTVWLWDLASRRPNRTLYGHLDQVNSVAFSPDGKTLATGSNDRTVRLWQVATGDELLTLKGHPEVIRAVAFSPDGTTLASGGADGLKGEVKLWRATRSKLAVTTSFDDRLDGYAAEVEAFDERDNRVELACLDEAGRPKADIDGIARVRFNYDGRDRLVGQAFFDEFDRPKPNADGIARFRFVYDDLDRPLEEEHLDITGQPSPNKQGIVNVAIEYGGQGRRTVTTHFGRVAGEPPGTRDPDVTKAVTELDANGNTTGWSAFGNDGKLRVNKLLGYARVEVEYAAGVAIDMRYFDSERHLLRPTVAVRSIVPGSQAEQIGLKLGDILQTYDGREIENTARFRAGRLTEKADEPPRTLVILRDGKPVSFQVKAGLLGIGMNDEFAPK